MSMREKLALVLKNTWHGDAAWTSPLSMAPGLVPVVIHTSDGGAFDCTVAVDAILDALLFPTPSVWREAMKDYESERPLHPEHGIKSAGQIPSWVLVETSWKALIRAIKEGK